MHTESLNSSSLPPAGTTLLGTASLRPTGSKDATFTCAAFAATQGETVILVSFDASKYPLEDHCRYAVHCDGKRPYTFPNFEFQQKPPGLRVGPWPGWRGIPHMPSASLKADQIETELQFQFWGDELSQHIVRAVTRIHSLRAERIVVRTTDPRLVPLEAQFYAVRALKPVALDFQVPSENLRRHPRLLITELDLEALEQNQRGKGGASFLRLEDLLHDWDRSLVVTPESKILPGPESLSPEDRLLIAAFVALIEPSPTNLQRGIKSLLDYIALTKQPGFAPLTIDTQSGETLFLLCVGYDWLFHHLSAEEEQQVRKRLWDIADICWKHLGYERQDYSQAHYLGCGMGLLAFSLLFRDEHPRAREWASHLAGVLKLALSTLPDDGFFPHGINLWIYEFGFLLRWLELLRTGGGVDLWPRSTLMSNASTFRAAATSPDGLYGITFGDPQYRVGGDGWCHYLIASRTGSGEARWLGDFLRDVPIEGVDFRGAPARRRVYECLWFPEHVKPKPAQKHMHLFPDGTQIFVRTSDTLFTFRSGPPLGKHRYEAGITGGFGHSDPCSGSFLFFQKDSLAIAGPGPVYRRDTSLHNVVTINGRGQIGDSAVWMPDFLPPSLQAATPETRVAGKAVSATVDLARSYFPHLAVQSLRRSILVQPGRYILGADVVKLAHEANIEWNIHSWEVFHHLGDGQRLKFKVGAGSDRSLSILCCSSKEVTWETGNSEFVPAYPHSGVRDSFLRVSCRSNETLFVWCIAIAENLPEIRLLGEENAKWEFRDGTAADFDGMWISSRVTP